MKLYEIQFRTDRNDITEYVHLNHRYVSHAVYGEWVTARRKTPLLDVIGMDVLYHCGNCTLKLEMTEDTLLLFLVKYGELITEWKLVK